MCASSPGCRSPDRTAASSVFTGAPSEALDLAAVHSNGYSFQMELTHKLWREGLRIVEVPIVFTERREGHSKLSGHIVARAVFMVWRLPCKMPAPPARAEERCRRPRRLILRSDGTPRAFRSPHAWL